MKIFKDKDLYDKIFDDLNDSDQNLSNRGLSFDDMRRLLKERNINQDKKEFLEELVHVVNYYRDERN